MKKRWILGGIFLVGACLWFACTQQTDPAAVQASPAPETPAFSDEAITMAPTEIATPIVTAAPTDTPSPEPTDTPAPTPATVTIGAVGDIMVPSMIVYDVKTGADKYDFSTLFAPMKGWFASVDLMCGNLEVPLAGEKAGYSKSKNEETGLFAFNSPDSLLDTLKADGFDVLTTANNHSMDKGKNGLFRTIETVRNAGFYQTGTYLDADDREKPLIVEVNGIRLGILASTRLMNSTSKDFLRSEAHTCISFLTEGADLSPDILKDIARVKEAGAEYVILFAHWDYENDKPVDKITRRLAEKLLEAGVDCIIGSHPHRVKGAEFLTVNRKNGPYTGLVLYSLGNFTANQDFTCMVGLFVRITLEKDFETNTVTLIDAAVLPTYVMKRKIGDHKNFTVVPAYEDPSRITGLLKSLGKSEAETVQKARELALKKLGTVEGLRVLSPDEQ